MTRVIFIVSMLCAAAFGTVAHAASYESFTPQRFEAAQQSGKPIVLDIWASWCPVCAKQEPAIRQIVQDSKFADLVMLRIDFDKEKALLRSLKVTQQSTLIAYAGKREVERSTGVTDPAELRALLAKAVDGTVQ